MKIDYCPESLKKEDFIKIDTIEQYAELDPKSIEGELYLRKFYEVAESYGIDAKELERSIEDSRKELAEFRRSRALEGLPPIKTLTDYFDFRPQRPDPIIEGILRKGHKMLISGASKAGKSFLLMELAVAVSEGIEWLGFQCQKGRVMYVNFEIDEPSFACRFLDIYKALGIEKSENCANLDAWTLRGKAMELDAFTKPLIEALKVKKYDMVIIDPIYKIMMGDENSASDMGKFCNEFDRIANETGCAVVYCHHHSKGSQGGKKAQDRASGSGVFARDPDAVLDIIELPLDEEQRQLASSPDPLNPNVCAWRMECVLREFPTPKPVNFWYQYPIHVLDVAGGLDRAYAAGDPQANLEKAPNRMKAKTKDERIETAFENLKDEKGHALVKDIAKEAGFSERCVRDWLKDNVDKYENYCGRVSLKK